MKYEIIKTKTQEEENMLATYLEDGWVIKNAYPLHDCVEYIVVQLNTKEVGQALDKMISELTNVFCKDKDEEKTSNATVIVDGDCGNDK